MASSGDSSGWSGLIGEIAGGVSGTVQGVYGLIQSYNAKDKMNRLLASRPVYDISQGYMDAYKTYQRMASSEMPGYGLMQDQIGQSTAKATSTAEKGAMSSSQFMNAALGSHEKELNAIRNLGIMSAQWRGQQQQNLAQQQNKMGELQDMRWDYNVNQPWGMQMNMAAGDYQAGMQNFMGGLNSIAGSAQDYAGTQSYLNAVNGLQSSGQNNKGVNYQSTGPGEAW